MSTNIEVIESLNKKIEQYNSKRKETVGYINALKSTLQSNLKDYSEKYGVKVSFGSLKELKEKLTNERDILSNEIQEDLNLAKSVIEAVEKNDYATAYELLGINPEEVSIEGNYGSGTELGTKNEVKQPKKEPVKKEPKEDTLDGLILEDDDDIVVDDGEDFVLEDDGDDEIVVEDDNDIDDDDLLVPNKPSTKEKVASASKQKPVMDDLEDLINLVDDSDFDI